MNHKEFISFKTFLFAGAFLTTLPSSFDVFAAHGRWDSAEIKSLIPKAFSLTILRSDQ